MTASDYKTLIGLFLGSFGLGLAMGYLLAVFKVAVRVIINR